MKSNWKLVENLVFIMFVRIKSDLKVYRNITRKSKPRLSYSTKLNYLQVFYQEERGKYADTQAEQC